jgi:murein endopeptidase
MRALVVLIALLGLTSLADARHRSRAAKHAVAKTRRRVALPVEAPGQSIGAPWQGRLQDPTRLPDGDGYLIRRPGRAFGTRTTVEYVERVLGEWREDFPDAHVLAIGDLSAEHGGAITEHHSHQSGRDADIGLVYNEKPRGYPESFVDATEDNLDAEATFALVVLFADTARADGGAQVMFLDFDVQGVLVRWGRAHGISEDELARLFQYANGRGASTGLVRHEPNHANHLHVRFKCPHGDAACQ